MQTKWQILEAKKARLRDELGALEAYMADLAETPFGYNCAYCKVELATEKDFAEHFLVPDGRYLNMGLCPKEITP